MNIAVILKQLDNCELFLLQNIPPQRALTVPKPQIKRIEVKPEDIIPPIREPKAVKTLGYKHIRSRKPIQREGYNIDYDSDEKLLGVIFNHPVKPTIVPHKTSYVIKQLDNIINKLEK